MAEYFLDNQSPVYRNVGKTKSIKLDNINNTITITDTTIPKTIIINSKEFSNGTQTLPYVQMYEKINACNAAVYPAPDGNTIQVNDKVLLDGGVGYTNSVGSQEIKLNDPGTLEAHLSADNIIHLDTNTGNYWSNNSETLQVNNISTPSYIRCSAYNGLMIQNDQKGGTPTSDTEITSTQMKIQDLNGAGTRAWTADAGSLTITDGTSLNTYIDAGSTTFTYIGSGQYTTMNASLIQANDGTSTYTATMNNNNVIISDTSIGIQSELVADGNLNTNPYLRLQNTNGFSNYLYFNELNAEGHSCFTLNNNERFFKQMNPFGFRQVELQDGDIIERDYPFVFCQGVGTIKLRDPSNYLDDNGFAGWSCIVSNYYGNDLNIDIASASSWYAHSNGGGLSNPIVIGKWSTCRITLVYSSIDSQYIWAVSIY
jgi:hypothetical protein